MPSENIIILNDRRPATSYTVRLTHHWDGKLEIFVEDVSDDEETRKSIAWAMRRAAEVFDDASVTADG